jgi:hypothetical protein
VFSTWLAKRVGGMVGEKNEVDRSVGGGTVLCNLLKQVAEVGAGIACLLNSTFSHS